MGSKQEMLKHFLCVVQAEWIFVKDTYGVRTIWSINDQRKGQYRHEYEIFQKTTQVAKESITCVHLLKCSCPFHSLNSPTYVYKLYYPWLHLILMLIQMGSSDLYINISSKTDLSTEVEF
jgi:hypothetical protein